MSVAVQPQIAIIESTVDDPELEELLERREAAKQKAARVRKAYADLDEQAKGRIRALELGEQPARIGRFVIGERHVPSRSVAFETEPTTRVSIRLTRDVF